MRKLYGLPEVLEMLPLSRTQLYREMATGRLPYIQAGTRRLFEPESIDSFIAALKDTQDGVAALVALLDAEGRIDVTAIPKGTTIADLEAAKRFAAERQAAA